MSKLSKFYSQRAKKHWAKDGDRNTTYFHQAVLKRRRRNTIVSIKDEQYVTHFSPDGIAQTFINYFRYIFSSANPNNGMPFISTSMPHHQDDFPYTIQDKEEIWQTLNDMKKRASPGPDGFNVEFYLVTWAWIGEDVAMLSRSFYETYLMPPHINDTNIALIPKKILCPSFLRITVLSAYAMLSIKSSQKHLLIDLNLIFLIIFILANKLSLQEQESATTL
jgi:hypothetical protein